MKYVLFLLCSGLLLAQPVAAQQAAVHQRGAADVNDAYVQDLKSDLTDVIRDIESFGTDVIALEKWVADSNYCASQDLFFAGHGASGADSNGCVIISPQ